jgi:hypothetical protein
VPDGVEFADVDSENGKLATANCPKVTHEAFLPGTQPRQTCDLHGDSTVGGLFKKVGDFFGRIIR